MALEILSETFNDFLFYFSKKLKTALDFFLRTKTERDEVIYNRPPFYEHIPYILEGGRRPKLRYTFWQEARFSRLKLESESISLS